jgi:phosphoketolase
MRVNTNANSHQGPDLVSEVMSEFCAIIESYLPADRPPSALTTKALIAGLAGSLGYLIASAPADYRSWDHAITKLHRQLRDQLAAQFPH